MVVAAERPAMRIVTNPTTRDRHMDLKVGSALRTSCVATVAEAEAYKRQDAEVEREERGLCMMSASPVAMVGSANSSKQTTLRWKAANAVVVEREVWC